MASNKQDVQLILEGLVSFVSLGLQQIDLQENFHIMKELGRGGYGSVLMVTDKKTGGKKALMLLSRKKTTEFRFLLEFSMSFFLSSHPHILGIYGTAFKTWEYFAFTQELATHGDLFALMSPHDGLPEDTVKRCAVQVSSALEFMDSKGLVHLDIKPDNILVFDKDCHSIKITDFGLSRVAGIITYRRSDTTSYMAPEMNRLNGQDALFVDSSLDVWSFAIVLCCLLTGEFPWQSADAADEHYRWFVEWQVSCQTIEPPSPWSRLPPGVLPMFYGLLATDCKKRSKCTDILRFLHVGWKRQTSESSQGTFNDTDATEVTSLLTNNSCLSVYDGPKSEDKESSDNKKDDGLNPLIFVDDEMSLHVGAEVEIG